MMFPNWAKNILFLLVYMISGLILVIIIEGLLSGTDLIPLNTAIESAVVHMRAPLLTSFLVLVTKISDPFLLSSLAVLIAALLIMRRNVYDAVLFLSAIIVAIISLTVLKNIFQITRPVSDIYSANGWSFPSGHATVATAFFFLLSLTFFSRMKTAGRKVALVLGSILAAVLISFSRLYLGAHWTLDILAGIALGLLSVSFTVLMFSVFVENKRSLRNRINS
ncbi:MAG: phosphatase PAP2 family protein [Candidatus Zambryskibacteria bacterium]|nr:phosphatase PAP2 family protein [Candidatus Zambryskibacteria bacterium]